MKGKIIHFCRGGGFRISDFGFQTCPPENTIAEVIEYVTARRVSDFRLFRMVDPTGLVIGA